MNAPTPRRRARPRCAAPVLLAALAGCGDEAAATSEHEPDADAPVTEPTWHRDIAPIVVARCGACHREGGLAPLPLRSYEDAAPWAALMLEAVERGQMPPFAADATETCAPRRPWRDDPRLEPTELELLRAWVEDGAPEGDPGDAAPLPPAPELALTDPDLHLAPPASVTVDGDRDQFLCFVLDPQLTEDRYLRAAQLVPGNERVVHHALVFADPDAKYGALAGEDGWFECDPGGLYGDALIAAWAPGGLPHRTPEGTATRLRAGTQLVLSVHYHPTGAPELDPGTALELEWYDGEPEQLSELALLGNFTDERLLPGPSDPGIPAFWIPAGAARHSELMAIPLPPELPELRVWMVGAHMHYLGVNAQLALIRPDAEDPRDQQECLLSAPRYQFEWQRTYAYDAPTDALPIARGGDTLLIRCEYDNSLDNPALAEVLAERGLDAPVDVELGDGTLDEMCLGVFGVIYPRALADEGWRP